MTTKPTPMDLVTTQACFLQDRKSIQNRLQTEYKAKGGKLDDLPQDLISLAVHSHGADSTMLMARAFDGDDRAYVLALAEQMQAEYGCAGASEKTLANVAAAAHVMYLAYSRRLEAQMNIETITTKRNQYIANLSKQADRAYRQYTKAISLLRSAKQPAVKLNVAAKEVYLAQNQQINT